MDVLVEALRDFGLTDILCLAPSLLSFSVLISTASRSDTSIPSTISRDTLLSALNVWKLKFVELANSVDQDEAAHHELPHLDLHCLPSSLLHSQYDRH